MACVARAISAGSAEATRMGVPISPRKVPSGRRMVQKGTMVAPVRAARTAGPDGSVVHEPRKRTGCPSGR